MTEGAVFTCLRPEISQLFSVTGQIGNILGFVGQTVSIPAVPLPSLMSRELPQTVRNPVGVAMFQEELTHPLGHLRAGPQPAAC